MDAIIFDIDGTLADCGHRLHHIRNGNRDWSAFFDAMSDDAPIDPVRRLFHLCATQFPVLLCSGRPDSHRAQTEQWLVKHQIEPYAGLYMRAAGDHRPDQIVKSQILDGILADGYVPFLVIDDRPRVIAMWRERGLTCLQCREWDEPDGRRIQPGILTIMVGPSGAGKSHWLKSSEAEGLGIRQNQIISTDTIREELCGDFRDQSRNEDVFAAAHAIIRTRLINGLPAVLDATNLKRKDRLAVVALAPPNTQIRYVVVNRPMAERESHAEWRKELPIDLLAKHEQTFRSQERDIMSGDGLPNLTVIDRRRSA